MAASAPEDDDLDVESIDKIEAGDTADANNEAENKGIELDDFAAVPAAADAPPDPEETDEPDAADENRGASDLHAVFDVPVQISAVLGHTEINVSEMLELDTGAIIELDRKIGEAIDIYVNNRLVARGEVVVVENRLGITMTEIIKQDSA
ncbi:MAG: flagellar motor switch protein FliN [Alphaproteobacteria bacterium]